MTQRFAASARPSSKCFLDFIKRGLSFGERWRAGRLLLQFEHDRKRLRRAAEHAKSGVPIYGAFVGKQVLVFFAVIVVDVRGDDQFAHGLERRRDARIEIRMADVKAELAVRAGAFLLRIGAAHRASRVRWEYFQAQS